MKELSRTGGGSVAMPDNENGNEWKDEYEKLGDNKLNWEERKYMISKIYR